jgi:hypothetical protein
MTMMMNNDGDDDDDYDDEDDDDDDDDDDEDDDYDDDDDDEGPRDWFGDEIKFLRPLIVLLSLITMEKVLKPQHIT